MEIVEVTGTYVTDRFSLGIFAWPWFFRTALPCSGCYHLEMGGMRLRKAVKRVQLLKIKEHVSSIWAKGCMFDSCVCVT